MANLPNTTDSNSTQTFFNGYFNQAVQISQAIYEQVYGYFYRKTGSKTAAESLTQMLLSLTYNNSLDPIKMMTEFEKSGDVSSYKRLLLSFFNSTKGSTSKLGYRSNRSQNQYVSRTILP